MVSLLLSDINVREKIFEFSLILFLNISVYRRGVIRIRFSVSKLMKFIKSYSIVFVLLKFI